MFLIVGLGNPGSRYRKTRHNLGFMVLESLAKQWHRRFGKGEGPYEIVESTIGSQSVLLIKPSTYMNRSGIAVDDLLKKYDVELSRLFVLCDDLNLPLGKLRLREKGSDGGHKGLASVITALGTEEFPRLRLGIGSDQEIDAEEYVLFPFLSVEYPFVNSMIEKGGQVVVNFVQNGIEWAMNLYNR